MTLSPRVIPIFAALLTGMLASALAQQSSTALPAQEIQDDDTLRISTRLVQVDGTVTGKDGREVSDLGKDDFELVVDGRPQTITYFSYIAAQSGERVAGANTRSGGRPISSPPTTTGKLRPEQVRRTVALVVANVSFESMPAVKKALQDFVDEQMEPGDLVSIIRPAEGAGVLQQLTTDKRLLRLAIDRLRWSPIGAAGVSAAAQETERRPNTTAKTSDPEKATANERATDFHDDVVSASWVRHLDLIVRGLNDLPGRKSVILFSDGLQLLGLDRSNQRTLEALHRITDRAIRALVVVNAIDSRGLDPLMGGAQENTSLPPEIGTPLSAPVTLNGPDLAAFRQNRVTKFLKAQDGLAAIAEETGGRFMQSTDLAGAMTRLLEQKGYYVIGYRPDEATFKLAAGSRPYHEIKVTVRRPNLLAHFRKGFYGSPDKERSLAQRTNPEKMVAALNSPLAASDVGVRLTSLFGFDKTAGSFVRSLLHVDAAGLSFSAQADGSYNARVHILAAAFGSDGLVADPAAQDEIVRVTGPDLEQLKLDGLVYELTIPIKQPGVYHIRAAVRDLTNDRIGSASQLIEVPDLDDKRLTLSGIVISGTVPATPAGATNVTPATRANGRMTDDEAQAGPAIRRFRRGMQLNYALLLLNAQLDRVTGRPQVETQVMLYRDGQAVYKGLVRKLDAAKQSDRRELALTGGLNLGADLSAGEYVLQVIATDKLSQEKDRQVATGWIDFDVVE